MSVTDALPLKTAGHGSLLYDRREVFRTFRFLRKFDAFTGTSELTFPLTTGHGTRAITPSVPKVKRSTRTTQNIIAAAV